MTFYEPNPEIKQTGAEIEEFVDDAGGEPEPPASVDPTGEAQPEHGSHREQP